MKLNLPYHRRLLSGSIPYGKQVLLSDPHMYLFVNVMEDPREMKKKKKINMCDKK